MRPQREVWREGGREDNLPVQSVAVGSVRQLLSGARSVWREVQVPESHLAANVVMTENINQHKHEIPPITPGRFVEAP